FTIMITRSVPEAEYGIWANINVDIVTYFTLLSSILPFWIIRFFARGYKDSAKTGVFANLLFGIGSVIFYVIFIPFLLPFLHISPNYLPIYLLASIQILETYLILAFQPILRTVKIETLAYGLLIEEMTRVILGYWLIMNAGMGLYGAMLALISALFVQFLVYLYASKNFLHGKIKWSYVKEWMKGSIANLYNIIGQRVAAFSTLLLIIVCGEVVGLKARAYYGAAFQIASVISYTVFLVFALYPRLLMKQKSEDISESFKLFFMFAIPMTVGIIVLADSFLTILGKGKVAGELIDYSVATPVLRLLAPSILALSISQVLNSIIFSAEKFDLEAKIPLKELAHSKIFKIFTLPYIKALIVLPTLYFTLAFHGSDPVASALYLAALSAIAEVLLLIIRILLARNTLNFSFPWRNILNYSFASTIMAACLLLIKHPTRISVVLLYALFGGITYFVILLAIDKEARLLLKSTLAELKSIFGGH
ncbi:hypothetical protein J7K27_01835, partial [Candidatus Bathyarchaeota archaeon]|nr:hypothetical protein [Candidatus Bathyarchaeota archaeon]